VRHAVCDPRCDADDGSAVRGGYESCQRKSFVEAKVRKCRGVAVSEDQRVRSMKAHAVCLGLKMIRVHVEVQLLLRGPLVVDVAEEPSFINKTTREGGGGGNLRPAR